MTHQSYRSKISTYHSPPEGVGVALEAFCVVQPLHVFLGQIHEVRREDEAQEADVERRYQLLQRDVTDPVCDRTISLEGGRMRTWR